MNTHPERQHKHSDLDPHTSITFDEFIASLNKPEEKEFAETHRHWFEQEALPHLQTTNKHPVSYATELSHLGNSEEERRLNGLKALFIIRWRGTVFKKGSNPRKK